MKVKALKKLNKFLLDCEDFNQEERESIIKYVDDNFRLD